MTSISQVIMPQFQLSDDPETWFNCAEQIFQTHRIITEPEKFGYLLQSLTHKDLTRIKDIVNDTVNTANDKYLRAKTRLVSLHGQSEDDKIRSLLQGTDISNDQKPSFILHEVRQLAPQDSESFIRGVWEKILPKDIKEQIAPWSKKTLAEQAEIADLLYKAKGPSSTPNAGTVAAVSAPSHDSRIDTIFNMLNQVQLQIAELSIGRRNRSYDRSNNSRRSSSHSPNQYHGRHSRRDSPAPHRSRNNRSQSRPRIRPKVVNEVCTFHYRFGERAFRCMSGCRFYKKKSEN